MSVIAGATVIESPVWTPRGSRFSIVQMTMKLSALSRMTSSSNSFHPRTLSSISTSRVGDWASAQATFVSNSLSSRAIPLPDPPIVNDGRRMEGKPVSFTIDQASSTECAAPERGQARPIFSIAALKSERSSALAMDAGFAPSISTPKRSRTPLLVELQREVQGGLPAEGRQDRVGAFALDDRRERPPLERLDVGARGQLRVGHDRRGVRVDEDDLVPLFPKRLRPLRPGVVELARLPDDDGARADEQYFVQVVASGHAARRGA